MNRKEKICIGVSAIIFLLILSSGVVAEPSKNMQAIISDNVSVMDLLCYKLQQDLRKSYQFINPLTLYCIKNMAEQTKNKESMVLLKSIEERNLDNFEVDVFFDYASNRLNIDIASHSSKSIKKFKQYWERKESAISPKYKTEEVPRYKGLHFFIVRKIKDFQFHKGYTMTNYKEDLIKKELIERLKIKIFFLFIELPESLFREYYDGTWKKTELAAEFD